MRRSRQLLNEFEQPGDAAAIRLDDAPPDVSHPAPLSWIGQQTLESRGELARIPDFERRALGEQQAGNLLAVRVRKPGQHR